MNIEEELTRHAGELGKDAQLESVSLVPRVRQVNRRQLGALLPTPHHAVLAVWDSKLPDERALIFLGPQEEAARQRIRADLIHQLFPRAVLLTERHRRARFCKNLDFSELSVEVNENAANDVMWNHEDSKARLAISRDCWNVLLPSGFLPRFRTTVQDLSGIVGQNEHRTMTNWHHVVDAGRTLREEFTNGLLLCSRKIVDRATQTENGRKELLGAINSMVNQRQLQDRRYREYCREYSDERQTLESLLQQNDVTLFVDSETVDDFLCLLQALRCYMGNNRCLCSRLRRVHGSEHQALGILVLGRRIPQQNRYSPLNETYLATIYSSYVEAAHEKPAQEENNGAKDNTPQDADPDLPAPIRNTVRKWINGTDIDELCVTRLIALGRQLAERHSVHEGRPLHYRFAYAPSASLWQEIEDVLSFEASAGDLTYAVDRTTEEQAKFVEAHWSIFQPERVFGVVDTLMSAHAPRIQRVVRVRPPTKWSGLEFEAMDNLAKAAKPCLVIAVLRQWLVRLSFSKDGTSPDFLEWDVREQKPKPKASAPAHATVLARAVGIGEADTQIQGVLTTVLSEVSEAQGEGALLIAVGSANARRIARRACVEMDTPEDQMAWRKNKQLRWVDRTLLRAMAILDGATLLRKNTDGSVEICPRVVAYPSAACDEHDHSGFSVIYCSLKKGRQRCKSCRLNRLNKGKLLEMVSKNLIGKGSRKHAGANLAALLLREGGQRSCVVSVSADGPIEKWPLPLEEKEHDNRA
jgi:hypothetical protein